MSEDLPGHRALVWYKYGIRDIVGATVATVIYMLIVFGSLATL